jgi:hypothetical protein
MNPNRPALPETRLIQIASALRYPATPDLWPALRDSIAQPASRPRGVRRWAVGLAAIVLAVAASLLASPEARAVLYRVIQLGAVRIFVEPGVTPSATAANQAATATVTPTPVLKAPLDLRGRTTLAAARQALGEGIRLPEYPEAWGEPDLVFVQFLDGPLAVLVWLDSEDPSKAELALHVLGPDTFAGKDASRLIESTRVNGREALWLVGPHTLILGTGETAFRTLVTGNVLLWSEDGFTFRLETNRTMEEAVRIAESLR